MWRVVKAERDVLQAGRPGGRWDDGTFDVLYTSTTRTGALTELYYHLSQGQPVIPSRIKYFAHEIEVSLKAALDLRELSELAALKLSIEQFGQLSYVEREKEYPTTQQVAEVAFFLGFDGILVPSARSQDPNLVIFTQRIEPPQLTGVRSEGPIDWKSFERELAAKKR